jgi:hypothetical protein
MEVTGVTASAASEGAGGGVGASFPESFSFAWLEALIAKYLPHKNDPITSRLERYASAGAIVFGVLGVLGALFLHNQIGVRLLQAGFALQCLCIIVYLVIIGRQAWLVYLHQHQTFAQDLDQQMVQYKAIAEAVRHYPDAVISTHLRYVAGRKSRLIYRTGFISGSTEKLGILPLLLAMYLQFKDWSFGGWKELFDHVHLLGNFLLSMLLAAYLVSWWALRSKGRLDLYETVLTEALVPGEDVEKENGINKPR